VGAHLPSMPWARIGGYRPLKVCNACQCGYPRLPSRPQSVAAPQILQLGERVTRVWTANVYSRFYAIAPTGSLLIAFRQQPTAPPNHAPFSITPVPKTGSIVLFISGSGDIECSSFFAVVFVVIGSQFQCRAVYLFSCPNQRIWGLIFALRKCTSLGRIAVLRVYTVSQKKFPPLNCL